MEIISGNRGKAAFEQIKKAMSGRIYRLIENNGLSSRKIIRLELACPDIDCLGWLNWQLSENKLYWSDREGEFETAGIGIADLLKSSGIVDYEELFSALQQGLSIKDKYLRYYGGAGFYNKEPAKEWEAFGSYFFMVPEFEIFKVKGAAFFAFNIRADNINLPRINRALSRLNSLIFSAAPFDRMIPRACSLRHYPDRPDWEKIFNENIQVSGNMVFEKIVLARKTFINFKQKINPLALLSKLKTHTTGCFHYYFQPLKGAAFLGATPERLFKRQGLRVESEALAGTRPRGKSEYEDLFYQEELFYSAKETLEHRYVVDLIKDALAKLCSTLQFDQATSILKLSTAFHLITRFQGALKKGARDAQLLTALHPTPAVAGYPLDKALGAILKIEPFCRGWYAGPVGFVGPDCVDFAVALRCALVRGKKVSLFAGAGIVGGSTAEGEWQEIENKNSAYMLILNSQC